MNLQTGHVPDCNGKQMYMMSIFHRKERQRNFNFNTHVFKNYAMSIKDTESNWFCHKNLLYNINYTCSNILTSQMCFSRPHFSNNVLI